MRANSGTTTITSPANGRSHTKCVEHDQLELIEPLPFTYKRGSINNDVYKSSRKKVETYTARPKMHRMLDMQHLTVRAALHDPQLQMVRARTLRGTSSRGQWAASSS